jgi:group II intron reverse transcriptase/maturase
MQSAETVLGVLRERGRRGLPCDELYRQLFNPSLFLLAYGRLYVNKGAMTPGVDEETVDGMSLAKIDRIIDALRHERYRFKPARRVYIPKKNGKKRPLGLPSWSDKLVGEVVRLLLEAYYEPRFSGHSHGFRPRRGCHTALSEVVNTWKGTVWFIELDIAQCFDRLDHQVMLRILGEHIRDNRFLALLRNMLQAGYLEDWVWNATLSGCPQGGVVSPILANIYLDRLDQFVENTLIPEHTRGAAKATNPAYQQVADSIKRARAHGDRVTVRALRKQQRSMPSRDPRDPGYRRLKYVRYADDELLGFVGPKAEAEQIKARLAVFLREELKLDLSEEKTLITHAATGAARFLGYEVSVQRANTRITRGRRAANGMVGLRVPLDVVRAKCTPYRRRGEPALRPLLVNDDAYTIVSTYAAEYRGLVNYYLLAGDVWRLGRVRWVMETSLLKTLSCKYHSSETKMAARYKTTIDTPHGRRTCVQVTVEREGRKPLTARFGGIALKQQKTAVLVDRQPSPVTTRRKELVMRLVAGRCEMCSSTGPMQVHHVGKLAHLHRPWQPTPAWAALMIRRRRKTLVVCVGCHDAIHHRQPSASLTG